MIGEKKMTLKSKIFVNARFTKQQLTGVQRYAWEIVNRLEGEIELISPKRSMVGMGHAWEQLRLPSMVPKNSLLWSPGGSGPLAISNQILTIHDTAHLEHSEWYNKYFAMWYKWLLPRLSNKVKHIITVSNYSRERIIEVLNVHPSRITSIPLGADKKFLEIGGKPKSELNKILNKYKLPKDYVLAVATITPRKNIKRILQAWGILEGRKIDFPLVIVGTARIASAGNIKIEKVPNNVMFLGYVPDEDLPALYRGAMAFIFASLYEGFGLPILEAMASGTPVITSNITSMPEIADDAAITVDPFDAESIACGIEQVLENKDLREELITKGLKRVQHFTWDKTANSTINLLKSYN
jgi:glycosyltransferase involved in cell wall biosynthesis